MKPTALHLSMPTSPETKDALEHAFVKCAQQRGETVSHIALVRRIVFSIICLICCAFGMISIKLSPKPSIELSKYPECAKRLYITLPIYFVCNALITLWNYTGRNDVASSNASKLTWVWHPRRAQGVLTLTRPLIASRLVATDSEYHDSVKTASETLNAVDFLDATGHLKLDVIDATVARLFNVVSPIKSD